MKKTDNVLPFDFDNRSVYSSIKDNYTKLVLPCCAFVRRRKHMQMWCPIKAFWKICRILLLYFKSFSIDF